MTIRASGQLYPCYLEMRILECVHFYSEQGATMRMAAPCKEEQRRSGLKGACYEQAVSGRTGILSIAFLISLLIYCSSSAAQGEAYLVTTNTYAVLAETHKIMENGDHAEALKKLKKLISTGDLNDYDSAVVYQTMAYAENGIGHFNKAADYFIKSLSYEALPEKVSQQLYFSTAQILIHIDRSKEGLEYLLKWFANEKTPGADAYILAAMAYYHLEDYKPIISYVNKALLQTDTPPLSWYELLLAAYFESKDYQKAAPLLEKIIHRHPEKRDYWRRLAATYQYLKQDKKALAVYELMYLKGWLEKDGLIRLARNYLYLEMPYKAASLIEKGMANGNIETDQGHLILLADSWVLARENSKAESVFKAIIKQYNDDRSRLRLAQLYIESEQWEQASRILGVTFKTDEAGLKSRASLLLGIAQYHRDNLIYAAKAFTSALSDKSTENQAKWWLEQLNK